MGSPIASITPGCAISRLIRPRFLSRENTVCIDERTRRSCARYTLWRGLDVPWKIRNLSQPCEQSDFSTGRRSSVQVAISARVIPSDQRRFYDTWNRTKMTVTSSKIMPHISDNDIRASTNIYFSILARVEYFFRTFYHDRENTKLKYDFEKYRRRSLRCRTFERLRELSSAYNSNGIHFCKLTAPM